MTSSYRMAVVLVAAALASGCHGKEGKGLPPPSGSGAPPAPSIPRLSDLGGQPSGDPAKSSADAAWTGTLYARHEAQLGPKVTGILAQVLVEEGARVKKGQVLFSLDAAQARLSVDQARAAIAAAQVGYDAAKLEYTRATDLLKSGSIAQASFDQAKAGYDRAQNGLDQARVSMQMAERGVVDSAVRSPIDGVVTAKLKSVGETVTMMPPTVVLVVQDIENLELRARLPERALSMVKEGGTIRMTVPSISLTREISVKRINPTIDARTRTVEVVADVENTDGKLKVGMLVDVAAGGSAGASSAQSPSAEQAQAAAPGAQ